MSAKKPAKKSVQKTGKAAKSEGSEVDELRQRVEQLEATVRELTGGQQRGGARNPAREALTQTQYAFAEKDKPKGARNPAREPLTQTQYAFAEKDKPKGARNPAREPLTQTQYAFAEKDKKGK